MHAYRIFDSVLEDHSWTADGRLCIAQQPQSDSFQETSPKAEIDALFSRLRVRSKSDRILCRAAKRLHADPSISLGQLASELGVSERYLLSGLRAILGVDPQTFLRKATSLNRCGCLVTGAGAGGGRDRPLSIDEWESRCSGAYLSFKD